MLVSKMGLALNHPFWHRGFPRKKSIQLLWAQELVLPRNSSAGLDTWPPVPVTESRLGPWGGRKHPSDGDVHEEDDDEPVDL